MKWDYKTIKFETSRPFTMSLKFEQKQLQQCLFESGAEGWELVDTITLTEHGWTKYFVLIFKRAIQEAQ